MNSYFLFLLHRRNIISDWSRMKTFFMVALVSVVWSISPIGSDAVKTKSTVAIASTNSTAASTPEGKIDYSLVAESIDGVNNGTSPCERYLRSVEVEIRNPRNHKFVTSNGWTERQRPLPEINVYSRIEDLPPSPQPAAATASAAYYQQQRDSYYQNSRQQQQLPTVRTSKRIIYYATLPDVIRPPAGYPPPGYPTADPYALGPGPYSADFRQLDSNRCAFHRIVQGFPNFFAGGASFFKHNLAAVPLFYVR